MMSRPDDFGFRLAILYACLFIVIGIQFPFFPLWLKARGLEPEAIGIVLAIPILMRIFAVPVINRAVDHVGDLRAGLIVAAFASVLGYAFVGFTHEFFAIAVAVALASIAVAPTMSLSDAYALKGLGARRRAYGPVRLWGSISFIAANLGTGVLLTVIAPDKLIWMVVAAYALFALATLWLPRLDVTQIEGVTSETQRTHLWRMPEFLIVASAASLIQASHGLYYGFSVVDWSGKGISSTVIGLLWGIGVMAEIVLFAFSGKLRTSPATLIAIGAIGATIRWIAMAFDPPIAVLVPVQCLHGLSFGATHIGAIQFIARVAGEKRAAAAQGDFSTIIAIGGAAAAAASGVLYDKLGDAGYWTMALMAAAGGTSLLLLRSQRVRL